MSKKIYDLIIIGAGPAGLTAGIFAGRRNLKTLIIGEALGGQMALAHVVENYPGIEIMTGMKLAEIMKKQAEKFGCEIKFEKVVDMELKGDTKKIKTSEAEYSAKAVILATGAQHRKLNVEGEEKFLGKGVSYCVSCDGPLFKGKRVAVIGGSDSAIKSALYLSEICKEVFLIHRRGELRAEEANQEKLRKSKVKIVWNTVVEKIEGKNMVEKLILKNVETGKASNLPIDGIFIEVGMVPTTEIAKKSGIATDQNNFIMTNKKQETNIPGVYAAGDVTGAVPQITVAVGDGATAATQAYFFLKSDRKVDWGEQKR